jgi:predicted nucleic acid-binding protein
MNDVSKFDKLNVVDTCSIWNILGSRILHVAVKSAQVSLSISEFVRYECLYKPGQIRVERVELQNRLKQEMKSGAIKACSIELEDLQDVEVLEQRKRVSKGELSSIVFAKRSQQAFMTDDKKATKLALTILSQNKVQSTSHCCGWLYFNGWLGDSDKDAIVAELAGLQRSLEPHLTNAYLEGLRCRLLNQGIVTQTLKPRI